MCEGKEDAPKKTDSNGGWGLGWVAEPIDFINESLFRVEHYIGDINKKIGELEKRLKEIREETLGGVTMNWIKCSDRLPEEDKEVIFYNKFRWTFHVGAYNSAAEVWECDWEKLEAEDVSYWAEIPEPPKEDE